MTPMLAPRWIPLLLVAFGPGALAATTAEPKRIAWVGATVHDETGVAALTDRVVVTRGDRVEALVPADTFQAASDLSVVDLHGEFLLSDLINTLVNRAPRPSPTPRGNT